MTHRLASLGAAALLALALPAVAQDAAPAPAELIQRDALFGNPERFAVQFSPDGRHLAWIAPLNGVLNVWVAPSDDLAQAKAVTHDAARGIRQYAWTHRPDTLLYFRDSGGDENFHVYATDVKTGQSRDLSDFPKTRANLAGISHLHPDAVLVGMNDRDPQWHDLYRVDLATGKRELLQRNDQRIGRYYADGDFQVRLADRQLEKGGKELLEPDGQGGWKKTGEIPQSDSLTTGVVGYTTDGKTLYYADSRGRDTAAFYAVDVASGRKTRLVEDLRADVGESLLDPVTGQAQAVRVNYLRERWTALDPALEADLKTLQDIGPGTFRVVSRTQDDRHWIVSYMAADTGLVYYRYDRGDGPGRVTRLFSAWPALDGKPLVPMWPQEIKSRDGLTLVSYLTLPRSADPDNDGRANTPVPMVLLVHGGPWARDVYGYSGLTQWLANRGYAVLQVNFRGSTGFGKRFVNAGNLQWGAKMHDDLIDAVGWAVRQKVTRRDQVAIMGGSYGGYATLAGLTFTPDTFKCGVDIVGPSNLQTLLKTIPPYWAGLYLEFTQRMGDPRTEEGRKLLTERSPLTHVDKIGKPLLIGQGANDPRVNQAESDQIVAAMKAKQIPVTYVLFPDEGHGFARPENSKAFYAVAEGFLGTCLGGSVQPIGSDFTGSSISVPEGADGVPGLSAALQTHTQQVKK